MTARTGDSPYTSHPNLKTNVYKFITVVHKMCIKAPKMLKTMRILHNYPQLAIIYPQSDKRMKVSINHT